MTCHIRYPILSWRGGTPPAPRDTDVSSHTRPRTHSHAHRTAIARAEGVRLRPRLEEKGGHASLVTSLVAGVEHRLVEEVDESCARRDYTKGAE